MHEIKRRLAKIEHLSANLDAIILISSEQFNPNFTYFTNIDDVSGFFFYNFSKPRIFTNSRDYPLAKKAWVKNIEIAEKGALEKIVKGRKIGIDKSVLSVDAYEKLKKARAKLVDISQHLENARAQKTKYEISCIRQACRITGKVFNRIENQWKGLTELEFSGLAEYEMRRFGAQPSFPTIVATGKNIAIPHHKPTAQKIKLPLLIDLGVRRKNYVSDVTRTIGSKWETKIENILGELYPKIKPDAKAKELDLFVRKALGKQEKRFITSLGHGIGVSVHEKPWISRRSDDTLKQNMAFTIEPGIYVKNGIRIENDFLLKEGGAEILTQF